MDKKEKNLSYEDFFKMAILKLRDIKKSRGIHSVYSGFNQAFREHFGEDPIKVTQELANKGKIEIRYVKGGVMIYLPGEAPKSKEALGKEALSKILNRPSEYNESLIDKVLMQIASSGIKKFPDDFIENLREDEFFSINLPGTPLNIDPNSQCTIVSPKRHFHYEARNSSEAKYIIYAYKIGQKEIKIPRDNFILFKAVTAYEKYCEEIKDQCVTHFLEYTNDEELSETLAREVEKKLDLRAKKN